MLLLKKKVEMALNVQSSEDGRLAFRDIDLVLQETLEQDPGTRGMPELQDFLSGLVKLASIVSYDATGFGTQQLNAVAMRNPWQS